MGQIRLDKWLSSGACLTRSQARKVIKAGRVTVDGETCRKADQKLDQEGSTVLLDGKPVGWQTFSYLMMNKPAGLVSATRDQREMG